MITKKSTACLIFLSCAIGSWLFFLKYSVIEIEQRIKIAKREIAEEEKNQHILKAEWKSLISPERLQRLSVKYLSMQQMEPNQMREFDPSLFHSEKSKYKKTKKLSEIVSKVISQRLNEE